MRVLVVVSPDKSDVFFANQLMKFLNVVGVVVENQTPERDRSSLIKKATKYASSPRTFIRRSLDVLDRTFLEPRQAYNQPGNALDFGEEGRKLIVSDGVESLYTEGVNAINASEYRDWMNILRPDVIAVCGASIMKADLLSIPAYGVVNLHGGLSQFYRGLFTTDWAIHNNEPECVGATVHFVSKGVDDGDVVYQGRPTIVADDNPNSLYEKVVRLGVEMMIQAVSDLEQRRCHSVSLTTKGRLYLNDSFTTRVKRNTWRRIQAGVLSDYLANKSERDQQVETALINDFSKVSKVRKAATVSTS